MAYMRIHCEMCGGTWEVYQRDDWKDDRARQCPHCFREIDRQIWDKEILPAFGAASDANAELFKNSTGYYKPIFTVDFMADRLYQEKRTSNDSCPLSDVLQEFEDFINA